MKKYIIIYFKLEICKKKEKKKEEAVDYSYEKF